MSRSGYTDDGENLAMWRGQVASAIRGRRGQKLLGDLLAALDAMPEKSLITQELETETGDGVCALGALGKVRGIDMQKIDPEDPPQVAAAFDIAEQLAQEIVYMNDEYFDFEYIGNVRVDITPEKRWEKMRAWVASKVLQVASADATPQAEG